MKNSLLMLLGGLACAASMAFLVNYLLSGPRLGPHYDLLLTQKKPAVAREILIINSEEFVEGSEFFAVLMALTEMDASNLILTGRLSPSATPITITEAEIRRRFIEEYILVGSNIRNLFEGIRLGSVTAQQAPVFVDHLVELTERGRDRLITALIDRDEELLRSIAVFGNFLDAQTKPQPDKDGKLRRVKPIDTDFEHPVYLHLKTRYIVSQIETSEHGQVLWLRSHDGENTDIMLDKDMNIITPGKFAFRRINIDLFVKYDEAWTAMLSALETANELGAFSRTSPEKIPLFLGEYSNVLLEELIKTPNSENRTAWIAARANYFKNLEEYFNSPVDMLLVNAYEEQIADIDSSNAQQLADLIRRRDELSQTFKLMREIYAELRDTRGKLSEELPMSLCIMGPQFESEYSALLANALITGNHVKPIGGRYALFWSIAASTFVVIIIFMLRPSVLLTIGLILSVIVTAAFSGLFIFFSYWIDPLTVLTSSLAGTFVMFFVKNTYLNYRASSFRAAYKTAVPKNILKNLIKTGRPDLSEVNVSYAAVIAIKDNNLFAREGREKSKDAVKIKKAFFSTAKKLLFNAGAVIAGYEGDTIIACFGSPLELQPKLTTYKWSEDGLPLAKSYHPVDKACALVGQLLKNEKISWRFGIDAGECSFSWTPETGFSVSGSTAVRARVLVSRTARYRVRAIVTDTVREKIGMNKEKIGVLYNDYDAVFEF